MWKENKKYTRSRTPISPAFAINLTGPLTCTQAEFIAGYESTQVAFLHLYALDSAECNTQSVAARRPERNDAVFLHMEHFHSLSLTLNKTVIS